jgi:hypothetical protein
LESLAYGLTPFQKREREASFGPGRRNTYKLFLFPLGHGRINKKEGPSPSGGTGMSEAIILLDFVLVNMEAVRERRKTTVTVWSSPPRYVSQVPGYRLDLAWFPFI